MTILSAPVSPTPELGQLVVVRDRHWVVTAVARSTQLPGVLSRAEDHSQHLVSLWSVEDAGLAPALAVIGELDPGARVLVTATLPRPRAGHFDGPDRLAAFLDAVRWGAI